MSSKISVSSAIQIHGDDMDAESDVMSSQRHDHSYYTPHQVPYNTPHQVAENVEPGCVQETQKESIGDAPTAETDGESAGPTYTTLTPLNPIKIEPRTPTPEETPVAVNLSPKQSPPSQASPQQEAVTKRAEAGHTEAQTFSDIDNRVVLALIYKIPIQNVPYNVTHEDLTKALSVYDDKVSVRTMRKVIPCLRISAYLRETEYIGKKKIKGLWAGRPADWPEYVPYKDPNNGEKIDGKLVPKANSEELRGMFSFLKRKFMQNIRGQISQMNQDDIENVKAPIANIQQEFDFSTQPAQFPPVQQHNYDHVATYVKKQHHQAKQAAEVKQEAAPVNVVPETPAPPADTSIPTFVNEFANSSPENDTEKDEIFEGQGVYAVEADPAQVELELDASRMVQFTAADGKTYFIQVAGSTSPSSDSSENSSSEPDRPETKIETNTVENRPLKRSHPVEMDVQETETMPVVVSGKRVKETKEEKEAPATNCPPIKQFSTAPVQDVNVPLQPVAETPSKPTVVEVAPQTRSQAPTPQPSPQMQQQPATPTQTGLLPPPSPFSQGMVSSTTLFPQSPVAPPTPSSLPYRGGEDMKLAMMNDLHSRAREKISTLSNMALGDVDISMKLSRLYQSVLWFHYQKALGDRKPGIFVEAAHSCMALVENAIMNGSELPREDFLAECDSLIKKYSEPEGHQATVLNVEAPEHPPVQAESLLSPKSPGTALVNQLGNLDLDKTINFSDFGIRSKTQGFDQMQLLDELKNILEPRKQNSLQDVEPENLLPLPEKLQQMGVPADENEFSQEQMDDFLQQLYDLQKECGDDLKTEVTKVQNDHDDSRAVNLKESQMQPQTEVSVNVQNHGAQNQDTNNVASQHAAQTMDQDLTLSVNNMNKSQVDVPMLGTPAVETKPCGPSTAVMTGNGSTPAAVPPSTQILSFNSSPPAMVTSHQGTSVNLGTTPVTPSNPMTITSSVVQISSFEMQTQTQPMTSPLPSTQCYVDNNGTLMSPMSPVFNNPVTNKDPWLSAKGQMDAALEENLDENYSTEDVLNDVMGLMGDYQTGAPIHKQNKKRSKWPVQPATPDDGGSVHMMTMVDQHQIPNAYLQNLIAQNGTPERASRLTQQQSSAPPPYQAPPSNVVTVNLQSPVDDHVQNTSTIDLATIIKQLPLDQQQNFWQQVQGGSDEVAVTAASVGMEVEAVGVNPAIPEVVANYESMDLDEEDMKPAQRGRKRIRRDC